MPVGVIGNTFGFGPKESRFEPLTGNKKLRMIFNDEEIDKLIASYTARGEILMRRKVGGKIIEKKYGTWVTFFLECEFHLTVDTDKWIPVLFRIGIENRR